MITCIYDNIFKKKCIKCLIYEIAYYHLLLEELNFLGILMYCDGEAAFVIVNNLNFHEHTKHIEIDSQTTHHGILVGLVTTSFISVFAPTNKHSYQ